MTDKGKLEFYELSKDNMQTYEDPCDKCGKKIEVYTQKDDRPEYYTAVYVKCDCGGIARFVLPVN